MPFTRRDVLLGLGGGLCGATLTPLPWKLLDDSAIWTQRRHALPVPPRGPVSLRPAACTLCPGGCALRVRMVGARPVATFGEAAHPLGGGACAIGLTLHHLPYHPLRLAAPAFRSGLGHEPAWRAATLDAAVARVAQAAAAAQANGRRVMVLDRRPGRVVSEAWRELLAQLPRGLYVTAPGEDATLRVLEQALATPAPLGLDLERARTLVSFSAPLLEGWGRPGRMLAARRGLRVVQLDAWRSPSAALADEWIQIAPGGEGPLAMALAHAVARETGTTTWASASPEQLRSLAAVTPELAVARSGVAASRIEALAHSLLRESPAVAIGGGDPGQGPLPDDAERAIALLDVVLGSVGREGGILARRAVPEGSAPASVAAATLSEAAPGSVGVLLVDAADDGRALPWPLVERALAKDALVVSLLPFDGELARRADVRVPAPAPLEGWDEVLPAAGATAASYALVAPLLPPAPGAVDTVDFVRRLAEALGRRAGATHEERLRARVAAIHGSGRGRLVARVDGGYADEDPGDSGAFFEALAAGGCWIDDPAPPRRLELRPPLPSPEALGRWASPRGDASGLALVTFAARATAGTTPPSPLLTKLYQESDLRLPATVAAVSPETAGRLGLAERQPVRIEGATRVVRAALRVDPTLPPGCVAIAAGPDPRALHPGTDAAACGSLPLAAAATDGTWREARVRVVEA